VHRVPSACFLQPADVVSVSGYTAEALQLCVELVWENFRDAGPDARYKGAYNKYKSSVYLRVSTLPAPNSPVFQ
jgi:cyclin-like protein